MAEYYKRLHDSKAFRRFLKDVVRSMSYMIQAEKKGLLDKHFVEKIMLAVTEVNGCEICSYYHTSAALKSGMTEEEIRQILSGDLSDVHESEAVGIYFAQHYADKRGYPEKSAWKRLVKTYGIQKALGILGATRAIMVGNTHGIAFGALKDRMKGKPVGKSSLSYELTMVFGVLWLFPLAVYDALKEKVTRVPLIQYAEESVDFTDFTSYNE